MEFRGSSVYICIWEETVRKIDSTEKLRYRPQDKKRMRQSGHLASLLGRRTCLCRHNVTPKAGVPGRNSTPGQKHWPPEQPTAVMNCKSSAECHSKVSHPWKETTEEAIQGSAYYIASMFNQAPILEGFDYLRLTLRTNKKKLHLRVTSVTFQQCLVEKHSWETVTYREKSWHRLPEKLNHRLPEVLNQVGKNIEFTL